MPDRERAKKSKFRVRKADFLAHCSRFPLFGKAAMFLLSVIFHVTTFGKLFPHMCICYQAVLNWYQSNAVMRYDKEVTV